MRRLHFSWIGVGLFACNAITGLDGYRNVDGDATMDAGDGSRTDAPSDAPTTDGPTGCPDCLVQATACGSNCDSTLTSCTVACDGGTQCTQKCQNDHNGCINSCIQACNGCGTASTCTPTQCSNAVNAAD